MPTPSPPASAVQACSIGGRESELSASAAGEGVVMGIPVGARWDRAQARRQRFMLGASQGVPSKSPMGARLGRPMSGVWDQMARFHRYRGRTTEVSHDRRPHIVFWCSCRLQRDDQLRWGREARRGERALVRRAGRGGAGEGGDAGDGDAADAGLRPAHGQSGQVCVDSRPPARGREPGCGGFLGGRRHDLEERGEAVPRRSGRAARAGAVWWEQASVAL
jgi:hypothetical protein